MIRISIELDASKNRKELTHPRELRLNSCLKRVEIGRNDHHEIHMRMEVFILVTVAPYSSQLPQNIDAYRWRHTFVFRVRLTTAGGGR